MLFNSYPFLAFFPIVAVTLFLLPHRLQWAWLLLASIVFYGSWSYPHLALILVVVVTTFFAAKLIGRAQDDRQKRLILAAALVVCLGQLFVFKYFDFAVGSVAHLVGQGWGGLKLILPVGISFYTFHAMSYVADVYRGKYPVEHHFGHYSLFVLYFPLLLAGPIERPGNLLHQIKNRVSFDPGNAVVGLRYILWGFFKKVAVADILAPYVGQVYGAPGTYTGPALTLATFFFAFQIYCDFSGYSDIAVGCAKIMGVELTRNFNAPYFSKSIPEFWRRWHLSLSTWFRDYVYIPMGGNRVKPVRYAINILATFLLSGVWHGANWTFVVWGGLHGAAMLVHRLAHRSLAPVGRLLGVFGDGLAMVGTFATVTLAWVYFRAADIGTADSIVSRMLLGWRHPGTVFAVSVPFPTTGLAGIALMVALQAWGGTDSLEGIVFRTNRALRWCLYYVLVFWTAWFGAYGGDAFIYFQF